jgi:hypothetical protein
MDYRPSSSYCNFREESRYKTVLQLTRTALRSLGRPSEASLVEPLANRERPP